MSSKLTDVKVYKSSRTGALAGLFILAIVFFGLTLPLFIQGDPVPAGKLIGLAGLWMLGLALTIAPLAFTLRVGENYIETRFFGFRIGSVLASDVETLKYGELKTWGVITIGKGLMGWARTPSGHKYFTVGEGAYGKEAIANAKRALEPKV